MMLRENIPNDDSFQTVLILGSLLVFLYVCICGATCREYYKSQDQLPFVIDHGFSTAVDVTPHIYQMQIPRYRKPNSPKNDSPV